MTQFMPVCVNVKYMAKELRETSMGIVFLPFPHYQIYEIRSAGQRGDTAYGKFRRRGDGAGKRVGDEQEESTEKEGVGKQPTVIAAHE